MIKLISFISIAVSVLILITFFTYDDFAKDIRVDVGSAKYNSQNDSITLQVGFGGGCDKHYNFHFVTVNHNLKTKTLEAIVKHSTKDTCEAYLVKNDLNLPVPNKPFRPKVLILEKQDQTKIILNIGQGQ